MTFSSCGLSRFSYQRRRHIMILVAYRKIDHRLRPSHMRALGSSQKLPNTCSFPRSLPNPHPPGNRLPNSARMGATLTYPFANAQASVPTGKSSSLGVRRGPIVGANWNFSWPAGLGGAGDDGFEGRAPGPAVDVAETSAD